MEALIVNGLFHNSTFSAFFQPAPIFVAPPTKPQRLHHSEAYLRYLERVVDKNSFSFCAAPVICGYVKERLGMQLRLSSVIDLH